MQHESSNQLKSGIALNYVNLLIGNLIPIFYTPVMLSLLGQNEYGLYKLSSSVTSYLSLISMGLGTAITRYLIKARTEEGKQAEQKMLGLFVVIFNVISVVTVVVGTILAFNLHHWYSNSLTTAELKRMQILVILMVCNMALGFSMSPYLSVVISHEKFLFYQGMNILSTVVVPIANIVVLYLGAASIGMTMVSLAISLLTRILYCHFITKHMQIKPVFKGLPIHQLRNVLIFSFWVFLSNVVGQLYNTTDTVMIGMIPALATTGVAVYNIGIMLSSIIGSVATGISSLLTPAVNKMVFQGASGEELTDLAVRVGRIQGIIATFLISGFVAFGKPFVYLYVGKGYEDAYWVALWIAIPALIFLVQSVCLSIITAENKHQFRSVMYLFIAILNVVGTWYMMKPWGIVGAAAMSGIATVIGQGLMMNWYYSKKTSLNIKRFWKQIMPIFTVPILADFAMCIINRWVIFDTWIVLAVGILIFSVVYFILLWIFTLNTYEKDMIKNVKQSKRR